MTTNLPFLRWLVAHPRVRAGETTTAFLRTTRRSRRPPRALPADAGAAGSASTSPPPPAPAPDLDAPQPSQGAGGEPSSVTAPMPGTVIRVHVHEG